ncbi:MAG: hypothetical protein QOH32_3375 [Bradyrhizobium sp.]|jgi:hypothetical protein|nr:hypothetical protein [Bradyrhizobium sp.]
MLGWIVILLSAALSIVLPVAIIYVRQTVKTQRRDVISDLATIFEPKSHDAGRERIIPSFEFVKFKYFVADDPAAPVQQPGLPHRRAPPERDFSKTMFVVSSVPLMAVLFALGVVAFGALITLAARNHAALGWVKQFPVFTPKGSDAIDGLDTWLAMLAVAYIASFLYVVRELLRAVANFELSPMTLLLSAIHVLFGVASALILASVASEVSVLGGTAVTTSALLLAAFAVGFVPELGVRTLLRATKLYMFKRDDDSVYNTFSATPVEVIDGIDTEVRSRLSLHNIVSVQNLATANPVMLFVETPYGVYQIIDWVAQAQLCSALGPKAVIEFWKLGIRTIFDLERALIGASSTRALRHEVGKIIVLARSPEERDRLGLGAASTPSDAADATVLALASILLDDLHIQRLRQIANRIAERLDLVNLHLIHIAERWKPLGPMLPDAPDEPDAPRAAKNGQAIVLPQPPDGPKPVPPPPVAENPAEAAE